MKKNPNNKEAGGINLGRTKILILELLQLRDRRHYEIVELTDKSKSTISEHLDLLHKYKIIEKNKEGFYRIINLKFLQERGLIVSTSKFLHERGLSLLPALNILINKTEKIKGIKLFDEFKDDINPLIKEVVNDVEITKQIIREYLSYLGTPKYKTDYSRDKFIQIGK